MAQRSLPTGPSWPLFWRCHYATGREIVIHQMTPCQHLCLQMLSLCLNIPVSSGGYVSQILGTWGRNRGLLLRWGTTLLVAAAVLYPLSGLWVPIGAWQWNGDMPGSSSAAVHVSLLLTSLALAVVVVFGTPIAWFLARGQGLARTLMEGALLISVLMPPLALGILLSIALGPQTWIGRALRALGLVTANSTFAFVITQVYASLGYYVLAARAAIEQVPRELEQAASLLGLNPWRSFWRVTFPLARLGLAAALSLAWVRAIGEFGAVMVTAYYPSGIPVQLWVNLQDAGLPAVMPLLLVFLLTALPLPWLVNLWARTRHA